MKTNVKCLCALMLVLLLVACSAPIGPPRVMHVASSDGIAYAELEPGINTYPPTDPYAQSEDGGKTWSQAKSVPQGIFQEKPVVMCDPNRESLCFRIAQKSQVDESNDGGKTWRVGWQFPPGREDYILKICRTFGCGRSGAWGPYDLSFLDQKGTNTLLVAMGEEGVLVRTVDGNWQRYGVLRATPSPLQATNLGDAFNALFVETLILFALSVICVPIVSFGAWLVLLVRMGGTPASGRRLWAMRPILFALAIAVLAFCILVAAGRFGALEAFNFALLLIRVGVAPALVIGFVWTWKRLATLTAQPMKVRLTGCGVFAALLIFPTGLLPLLLWAFGLPVSYDVALWMALILGLGALAFAIYVSVSTAITATTANTQTGER